MGEPLDVLLRVRMRYEAQGGARAAVGDLDQIKTKATQLGTVDAGSRLSRDLRDVGTAAGKTGREVAELGAAAVRLGQGTGPSRLQSDLKGLAAPAQTARRDIRDLSQAATRLGAIDAGSRLGRELREVGAAAGRTGRDVAELGTAAARLGQGTGPSRLQSDLKGLAAPAQAARREIQELGTATRRLGDATGPRELERELERAGRRADDVRRRVSAIGTAPGGRQGEHRRFEFGNEALSAAGAGGLLRFGMSGAGVAGVGAGVAIGAATAGIAKASREAIGFETAMAEVRKAIDDISPDKFAALESTILRTSRETGIAKEKMAQLVAEAGFAGRPTEELARFAEFGAKAAGAFSMTPEDTGDKLAKLGNVFKLTQAGIEDLADGVNVLGDSTAAKERQVIDFLARTGQTGAALKFTALQTAAIGAAAISTGKEAEVAATGFNAFALKLGDAEHQSKEFKQGLRSLGLSSRQLKNDLAQNPVEGFLNVLERLNKLPDSKKLEVANRIGGMEYGDDLLAYAGAIDQIRAALGKMQDQSARAGSVEKTFKIFDATTQSSINRAGASMEAFATKIGQRFTPAIRDAAHYVERLFGGMTKAIERGERAEALAAKLAKGGPLTKDEQAEVDANPRLKSEMERNLRLRREAEDEAARTRRFEAIPGAREGAMDQMQRRQDALDGLKGPALGGDGSPAPWRPGAPALPGTGKRSALSDDARVSLAAYTDAVENGLDRTERIVRESTRRMREDLALKARVDLGADRFGSGGGARIETAAYGGVPFGGGYGGGGGSGLSGGGEPRAGRGQRAFSRYARGSGTVGEAGRRGIGSTPGRFGGLVTGRARAAASSQGARFGAAGSRTIGGGGQAPRAAAPDMTPEQAFPGVDLASLPAGMRNNNPGNLKYFNAEQAGKYAGALGPSRNTDEGTPQIRFNSPQSGMNAMAQLLRKKGEEGRGTANQIIAAEGGWTPGNRGAAANVARGMGLGPDDPIDLKDPAQMQRFMRGLITQEHGPSGRHYPDAMLAEAARGANAAPEGGTEGDQSRRIKGFANLMRGQYGAPGENLTRVEAPSGKKATVHAAAAESFQGFLKDLEGTGYKIDSLGGYANRGQANGSGRISQHAYGNAIDINPSRNPYKTSVTDMPGNVSQMAAKWGLSWGGDWSERSRDPMHFEWTGAQPWKNKAGPVPTAENKPAKMPFGLSGERLEALERTRADQAAQRLGAAPLTNLPEGWRRRAGAGDDGQMISPRFSDPSKMQVNARGGAEQAGGGGPAGRTGGGGGPSTIQHFHGGFDEQATARRAVLEQNREIRRTQARALHDIGRVA